MDIRNLMGRTVLTVALLSCSVSANAQDQASAARIAEAPEQAFEKANRLLQIQTQDALESWWEDGDDWAVDLALGTIEFRNERGWIITAPVQVVGTYNTLDGTFMWGWDHPSVPDQSAQAAQMVQQFGETHGLEALTTRVINISEEEAWELTALADYLSGGSGAYRGPFGTTLVFMTYGEITISRP